MYINGTTVSTADDVKSVILQGIYGTDSGIDLTETETNALCAFILVVSRYTTFMIDFVIRELSQDHSRVRALVEFRSQAQRTKEALVPRPALGESGWVGWTAVLTVEIDSFDWNDQFADHHVGSFEDACRKCELHNALEVL